MDSKKKKKKKVRYRKELLIPTGNIMDVLRNTSPSGEDAWALKARRSGMKSASLMVNNSNEDASRAWQNEMDNDLIDL